ncbi:MAG: hypothetical protein MZW92_03505 [Comamonadaceae bacterium]|nr:hypothetical protein [Comamonadaceae bacterium]
MEERLQDAPRRRPPAGSDGRAASIVLGVIGADCHSVGNKILDAYFTEAGFHVVNLGVMVSQERVPRRGRRVRRQGHPGLLPLRPRPDRLRGPAPEVPSSAASSTILLYVGGNLVVGKTAVRGDRAQVQGHGLRPGLPAPGRPGRGGRGAPGRTSRRRKNCHGRTAPALRRHRVDLHQGGALRPGGRSSRSVGRARPRRPRSTTSARGFAEVARPSCLDPAGAATASPVLGPPRPAAASRSPPSG